jgi:RNA polymerase sigma-70 factor (ECF subfamily)
MEQPTEQSDEQLIEHYRQGDEAALTVLIERHFNSIYSYVFRFVKTTAEAEDVVQEVFIKVWRQIGRFKPGTGLRPWLFRIARNTAIDHLRKKKAIPLSMFEDNDGFGKLTAGNEAVFMDTTSDVLEESIAREEKATLSAAVGQLPLQYREVLVLRAEENLTFEEIGTTIGKPLNTVKSLYRRGLVQLHQIILAKRSS